MSHEIVVEFQGDHVYARHTGEASYGISLELWRRIMRACAEHRCCSVLGESDTSNVLSTLEAFSYVDIARQVGLTLKHRIAWVNHNPEADEKFAFIENVLKNRCLANGQLFKTVAEAKRWLLSKVDTPVR